MAVVNAHASEALAAVDSKINKLTHLWFCSLLKHDTIFLFVFFRHFAYTLLVMWLIKSLLSHQKMCAYQVEWNESCNGKQMKWAHLHMHISLMPVEISQTGRNEIGQ